MDGSRFDELIQALSGSRRSLVSGTLAGVAGWLGLAEADARKKHKQKKKHKPKPKPEPNAYGCLDVGAVCTSEDQCCSGICNGKNGKRKCRGHDTGICKQDAPAFCELENQQSAFCDDFDCACFRTTAGSSVCAQTVECAECRKDADCAALGYPSGSACIPFGGEFACEDLCESGMACTVPCGAVFPEP